MSYKNSLLVKPKYRPDIDGLRAVAILVVVLYHAFPLRMPGGFIGVDVFFVISGFLISTILFSSLERERFSIVEFYVRRVQRIFPALILVLIVTLAFGWFVLLAEEYKQLGKHTAAGVGFVQNFILFSESGYFDNAAGTKPLLHLWSIAVEEQFYIFWPLLLAFVWNREWSFLKITAGIGVISFIANIYLTQNIPAAAFYLPISRFWELMIGGILAYTILHRPELIDRHKNWQALLGFALIATALFLLDKGRDFPGFWALLPTIGTALIISAGQNAWLNQKLLANRLMVGIGLISYPLYLWHWPLLSFAQILESSTPSREIRVAAVVLAFFLGWITYRFVEMPIRFGRNKSLKVSLLIVGMIFVGLLGYKIHSMDGVPSRESLKSIAEISEGSSENLNPILCTQFGLQDNQTEKGLNCSYSSTGAQRTVAVFGDSHAAAAFVGIAEHLKASSINTLLLSGAGCPYLLGASVGDTEQIRAQCADNTERAISILLSDKSIKKVFILTRGPLYVAGKNYNQKWMVFKKPQLSFDDYIAGLQKTVNVLHNGGKKVYYITENPELDFNPKACITRPFRFSQPVCSLAKKKVMLYQDEYLQRLKRLNNVTVINLLDKFCPNDECKLFHNDKLLYRDTDHLSLDGSRFQADLLSPQLLGQ